MDGCSDDRGRSPVGKRVRRRQLVPRRFALDDVSGTYHLTSQGQTSWHGFAEAIRDIGLAGGLLDPSAARLKPITTPEYPTPARRPAYSVLSNRKLSERFGIALPDWRAALELCLAETTLP